MSSLSEKDFMHILLQLTLCRQNCAKALSALSGLSETGRNELMAIADQNHVIVRALEPVVESAVSHATATGRLRDWAEGNLRNEQMRIENAVKFLQQICTLLESSGCPVAVMKTLDHWPDFGSDLDLYTTADAYQVRTLMTNRLQARQLAPSWGDRLAHKLNFAIEGLPQAVEIHVQRLGQTGEHTRLARRFVSRRVPKTIGGFTFMVPAPEERIIVATLQRMYRHFFFRISDILNSAALVESGALDFGELKKAADLGEIWPGVCCYLNIVSGYFQRYTGRALNLPREVVTNARFGAESTFVRARFIRVPVMPHSAGLYTRQLAGTAARGSLPAAFRLALLPPLACAAAMSLKLTGSDKGVW